MPNMALVRAGQMARSLLYDPLAASRTALRWACQKV